VNMILPAPRLSKAVERDAQEFHQLNRYLYHEQLD
jgi:hypothetical protein